MAPSYEPGLEAAPPPAGLEIAPQHFPEVNYQSQQQHQQPPFTSHDYSQYQYPTPPTKLTPSSTFASPYSASSPHTAAAYAPAPPPTKSRTICGCTLLVFVLSCIIAVLSAAVIGLAAGTGVEAVRANNATAQLAVLSSSLAAVTATRTASVPAATGSVPAATAVASVRVDDGCADDPDGVTGSNYTSFSLLGGLKFTRYCNRDAKFSPLMSLFTSSFSTCMDACAGYTKYLPTMFGRNNSNATCGAVSFIPLWTTKGNASAGGAPGNCYLKPGPQNESTLSVPNIGTPCHAAFWTAGSS